MAASLLESSAAGLVKAQWQQSHPQSSLCPHALPGCACVLHHFTPPSHRHHLFFSNFVSPNR